MSYSKTELAELVCTRISHDLIGNIGAISSALELIGESDNTLDDVSLKILTTGADTLKARQKFFRLAFGLDTKKADISEVQNICADYLATIGSRSTPLSLIFHNASPELAKILCLSVMIAAEVYIKGGSITIDIGSSNMKITAVSDYKLSAGKIAAYQEILKGKYPEDNISQFVQLIYLQEMLGPDVAISVTASDNAMEMIIG